MGYNICRDKGVEAQKPTGESVWGAGCRETHDAAAKIIAWLTSKSHRSLFMFNATPGAEQSSR